MECNLNAPSLLPYLDSTGAHFSLRLSLVTEEASSLEKAPFPFVVITDSDPLTRLIEARLLTDAGSEIKKVFLLVQKDQYLLARDELRPIGNQDIDTFWQKAFSSYESGNGKDDSSFITLACQTGGQRTEGQGSQNSQNNGQGERKGCLLPFQSLFFCKHSRLFFAPPCPECGLAVQQCCDDDLLIRCGLQPYSTSLKRYLFCPSCVASGTSPTFYTLGLESFASPGLKDRWDLIRGFGHLLKGGNNYNSEQFICWECPGQKECYSSDSLFLSRIVPFSFYPFRMFIIEAMSLHAMDFLSLVSGASCDEIETQLASKQEFGRAGCLKAVVHQCNPAWTFMFFGQADRHFLEVLHLKLSFLSEVIRKISTASGSGISSRPDLGLSLDQIWVKLAKRSGLLPLFWSFSVEVLNLGKTAIPDNSPPRPLPPHDLHVLGLIWFYALIVNRKQNISKVYQLLRQAAMASENDAASGNGSGYQGSFPKTDKAFAPENIFWNPEDRAIDTNSHPLWEKSLDLGWSLLKASLHYSPQWSGKEFLQHIETLREEVKSALFQGKTCDGNWSDIPAQSQGRHLDQHLIQNQHPMPGHRMADNTGIDLSEGCENPLKENNKAVQAILTRIMDKWRVTEAEQPWGVPAVVETGEAESREAQSGETESGETELGETEPGEIESGEAESREIASGEAKSGEEELAAWASSNRLGEWTSSDEVDEEILNQENTFDNGHDRDEFLAGVTARGSERKIRGKRKKGRR
ncbi:MAG: hypothetical protein AB1847_09255 [bacterium]